MARRVWVTAYDPAWEAQAAQEARRVQAALGENCPVVYHIGSTSVPGLTAKPILDLLPLVEDLSQVDRHAATLEALGYEYLGEFGIPGRRYLRREDAAPLAHVHIFQKEDQINIRRHVAVREYLRAHREAAEAYGALKEALARQFPWDLEGYCDGKDSFVKDLEQKALAWWQGCPLPEK